MPQIDLDLLLREADPESPSGPNLEYDPAFLELEEALAGKPEVQYGDTISAAVPPEWKTVKALALELLGRSRDLRLAVPLSRALLALHGMPGFAEGVALVERLLAERWDSVHPQLDADDGFDPTLRINSLSTLVDGATVLRELKDAPLVLLPALGPLSLRMIEVANGEAPPPAGQEKLALSTIEAALADVGTERMTEAADALERAYASVLAIERALVDRVGNAQALNLEVLVRVLRRARDFLPAAAVEADLDAAPGLEADAPSDAAAPPAASSGEIRDRADVLRMLEKICKYYQRHEPSSPVPLLLERASRLVTKNFIELLEDLAPGGIAQLAAIRGPQPDVSKDA
jgi:type VI secretion system protein ImpA